MSFDLFNDPTMQDMEYALNSLSLRQQVIANNIANVQTPGFLAQDVSFASQLSSILDGQEAASPNQAGSVVTAADLTTRADGNTVNMEHQMSQLSQTNLLYDSLTQLTADRLSILKTAITG